MAQGPIQEVMLCNVCGKQNFSNPEELCDHVQLHMIQLLQTMTTLRTVLGLRPTQCNLVDSTTTLDHPKSYPAKRAKITHTSDDESYFSNSNDVGFNSTFNEDNFAFTSGGGLKIKLRSTFDGDSSSMLDSGLTSGVDSTSNSSTLTRDTKKPGKSYECKEPDCTRRFSTTRNLIRHQQSVHSDEKPYPCTSPGCTYRSKRADALKAHFRSKHGKIATKSLGENERQDETSQATENADEEKEDKTLVIEDEGGEIEMEKVE